MAGKPVTDPQNFTPHEAIESPASIPAVPFHFDHREPSPSTSKPRTKGRACAFAWPRYCAPNEAELPPIVIVPRTVERYTS